MTLPAAFRRPRATAFMTHFRCLHATSGEERRVRRAAFGEERDVQGGPRRGASAEAGGQKHGNCCAGAAFAPISHTICFCEMQRGTWGARLQRWRRTEEASSLLKERERGKKRKRKRPVYSLLSHCPLTRAARTLFSRAYVNAYCLTSPIKRPPPRRLHYRSLQYISPLIYAGSPYKLYNVFGRGGGVRETW